MNKELLSIMRSFLIACFCFVFAINLLNAQTDFNWSNISTELTKKLDKADDKTYFEVLVMLKDQVDITSLKTNALRSASTPKEIIPELISTLQRKAEATQPALVDWMKQQPGVDVKSINGFWITNVIFVRAQKKFLAEVSNHPSVSWVEMDQQAAIEQLERSQVAMPLIPKGREEGLTAIKAPFMWRLGYTGYGRKVLVIDSGQDYLHPALRTQFSYNYAGQSQTYYSTIVGDLCEEHGTHVAGTVVGIDRVNRDTIGSAFNALWLASPSVSLKAGGGACTYKGGTYSTLSSFQWALNPDRNTKTTDDVPDVINNSWGRSSESASVSDCVTSERSAIAALDAAGVAIVFSNGNNGPSSSTVSFPAGLTVGLVVPFAVGALNGNVSGYPIADFSSRGPTLCSTDGSSLSIKPEVSAPGVNVRSSVLNGAYANLSGTSMSAPHVTGAILLLKEAFPTLSGNAIATALYNSATDLGGQGEDNTYGKGIIDLEKAYNLLVSQGNKPVPPIQATNDVINVNAKSRTTGCNGKLFLEVTLENAGKDTLRTLDVLIRREGANSNANLAQIPWKGVLAPGRFATYQLVPVALPLGTYMVEVDLENPNGKTDERPLNNQLKERISIVSDPLLPVSSTTIADGCLGSRTLLTANYTGAGVVRWFDRVSDGTPLATGNTYYTGPLTKDTIFYSELLFSQKTGLDKRDAGTFVTSDSVGGLYFNCFSPFILKTVLIYPARTGILTILMRAPDGTVQQRLFNITKLGEQRVTLNFNVKLGNGYTLEMTRGRQLTITTSNLKLPYNVNGVLSIVRSTNYAPQSVYAYFYDWEIDYAYPCGRVPLFVNINKNSSAPVARFSTPKSPVPFINGAGIANFQDSSTNARSWFWDFGDGQTSSVQNPQNTYKNAGFYTVAFAASNAQGCSDVAYKTIEVKITTAVDDITKLGQQITVFPNPATNQINVGFQLEKTANVQMQVTNVLGQTLQLYNYGDVNVATQQVDTQPLPSGSYFLVFAIDGKRIVKKIQILEK